MLQAAETRYKVAEASYESALDSVRATKAQLQDRRAAYALALKQLDDAVVRAPIAGVVSERPVQVGEYIAQRTVVATIVQMNPLKLRTGVQERHAGVVEPGQPVQFRVEAFGDRVFTGKVAYMSPSLDQTMRTFTVEALVDNPDRLLKPGFFAKGVILTRLDTERAGGAGRGGVGAGRRGVGLRHQGRHGHAAGGGARRAPGRPRGRSPTG